MLFPCFQAVLRGTPFIRGPNVPTELLKRRSRNSRHGGPHCWIWRTITARSSPTNSTPVRTFMTVRHTRCSSIIRTTIRLPVSTTIRAIFCFNNSIISTSSDFTGNALRDFTLRMPNSAQQVGSGFTVAISLGLDVRRDSAHSATDKWISHKCLHCSPRQATTVGQCWNGNAVSKVQSRARQKVHPLSPNTS